MKMLGWILLYAALFLLFSALAAYPVLAFVEWLPICPSNPQGMRERECGYGVIWLWPLLTVLIGALTSGLLCRGLSLGAHR